MQRPKERPKYPVSYGLLLPSRVTKCPSLPKRDGISISAGFQEGEQIQNIRFLQDIHQPFRHRGQFGSCARLRMSAYTTSTFVSARGSVITVNFVSFSSTIRPVISSPSFVVMVVF